VTWFQKINLGPQNSICSLKFCPKLPIL